MLGTARTESLFATARGPKRADSGEGLGVTRRPGRPAR